NLSGSSINLQTAGGTSSSLQALGALKVIGNVTASGGAGGNVQITAANGVLTVLSPTGGQSMSVANGDLILQNNDAGAGRIVINDNVVFNVTSIDTNGASGGRMVITIGQ